MSEVAEKKRNKLPLQPSARDTGEGLKRALIAAGYKHDYKTGIKPDLTRAAEVLTAALPPGQGVSANQMAHLVRGRKDPLAGRLAAIVGILGLNIKLIWPWMFDAHGNQITRMSHPERFPNQIRDRARDSIPSAN